MDNKLKYLVFHITEVCENNCIFCYMGDKIIDHPPLNNLINIIDRIKNKGIKKLLITGGDPCLYPNLEELLIYCKKDFYIELMSNSLDFSGIDTNNIDEIQTTILGKNEKIHNKYAQNKIFSRLVNNMKKIIANGSKIGIAINMLPDNYEDLYSIARNLIEIEKIPIDGIQYFLFQRIIPKGNAEGCIKYGIKNIHINTIMENIDRINIDYGIPILFEDPFPLCTVDEKYHKYITPCIWGFSKGSINFHGDISRCGADYRHIVGNIFENDICNLWENSEILRSFRGINWMPKKCQSCILLNQCRCGCSLSQVTNEDHVPDILFQP